MLGPSLVYRGGIKTETYYIDGKKYSSTFFGINMDKLLSSSHGSGRFAKHVELFDAKIRHDFNISQLN